MATKKQQTKPSKWQLFLQILGVASAVGPAVVAAVDPGDAELANKLGGIATKTVDGIQDAQK